MAQPIWPRVPPSFVKGQLIAHKLLGLTLAAVMYLVCITGAIAVFYGEFERWEQPGVPEMSYASPEAVGRAVAHARAHIAESGAAPADVYVITPSAEMPRLLIDYETDVLAFDSSAAVSGDRPSLEVTAEAAMAHLAKDSAFRYAIDVRVLRKARFTPLPIRVASRPSSDPAEGPSGASPLRFEGRLDEDVVRQVTERVLVREVNASLVDHLNASGSRAIGLHSLGSCVLFAEKMLLKDKAGTTIDLGYVGNVAEVNAVLLRALCEDGFIPVLAPVAIARDAADARLWS